ncbi:MAG: HEAT repeat domain-containing protein [Caldilineaceae bacterium]
MADLLQSELTAGGCLVLLDGLDEIVEADDRRGVVQRIEDFIRRHDQGGQRGGNRFLVTSRIAGYRSAPLVGSGGEPLPHYVVQEMDDEQIGRFLDRWCRAVEDFQTPDLSEEARHATAKREIDGIQAAISKTSGVRRLAGNPLMLRVLALIHRTGARLPQKRVELYRLAADTLARTWRTAQGVPESALISDNNLTPLLGQLAYWMHEHKPSGIATEREVYAQLGAAFAKRNRIPDWDPDEPDLTVVEEIDKFLLAVREHTGLFVERAPKRYGFMHLTFEEYYAARHLVARSRTRAQLIRQHLHDPRWEEPILLALGFVGLEYTDEAADLVEGAILAQGEEAEELGFVPSEYEELLGRDYLFTLRVLGDEIPVTPRLMQRMLNRLAAELLYRQELARFQRHYQRLQERLEQLQGSDHTEQLAAQLLPALGDEEWNVRSRAAASLGQLGQASPAVVSALVAALGDEEWNVRYSAAASLGQLGQASPAVVSALVAALGDEEWNVRYSAAASLGQLGQASPAVVSALVAALGDESVNVRSRAAESLVQLGQASPAVVSALVAALGDESVNVRSRAAESLVQLGQASPAVVSALVAALGDEDNDVRSRAAASLGQLGHVTTDVIESHVAIQQADDWPIRRDAAQLLGQNAPDADTPSRF